MRWPTVTRFDRAKATAAVAGFALLAAACGSGGGTSGGGSPSAPATASASTPTGTARPTSVLCQDVAALRASLAKLTHVKAGKDTASELAADLNDVKAKLTTLASDAGDQWNPQVGALRSALAALQAAVSGLGSGTRSVTSVLSALGDVTTAARNLLAAVNTRCPSSSTIRTTFGDPGAAWAGLGQAGVETSAVRWRASRRLTRHG